MPQRKKITLGKEYDEKLLQRLKGALEILRAKKLQVDWGVGGSQEISSYLYDIGGSQILVELETYIGLTLEGDSDIVDKIIANMPD
jgi:hypothetical protein